MTGPVPLPVSVPLPVWRHDVGTLLTALQYGCPPGGWSDPDRKAKFVADVRDIERRLRMSTVHHE